MISFKQFLSESTRGVDKWIKYFGNDTETSIKADTPLLAPDGSRTDKVAKKGEKITVLAGEYDTRPLVKYNGKTYRVKFTDVEKPTQAARAVQTYLKPDKLGVDGVNSYSEYPDVLKKAIDDHSDIPAEHTDYLKALVDLAVNPDDSSAVDEVVSLWKEHDLGSDSDFRRTVDNDFMEALGPMFVVAEKPEFEDADVEFPSEGNAPNMDFTMTLDGVTTEFSSKRSGGRTNTLKVETVLNADIPPKLKKKYRLELELLTIIKDSPVKAAPQAINLWLKKNLSGYVAKPDPQINLTAIAALDSYVVKTINESDLDFLDLVRNAVPELWYVRAKLKSDGTLKVEPLESAKDFSSIRLRTKNSPGHMSDKIGFEV